MSKLAKTLVGAALAVGSMCLPAWAAADIIDPNFIVCAYGTTNVSSCGTTDPQLVTSTGVSVGVNGAPGLGPLNPFLILVAVPDLPTPSFPGSPAAAPIWGTSSSLTITAATSSQYGQTNSPGTGGYLGEMTSGSSDLYSLAGLLGGNASFNFTNMASGGLNAGGPADQYTVLGLPDPTSFSIYEFMVTISGTSIDSNLGTSSVYNLPFSSVAAGTYIAAWGIEHYPVPATGSDHVYESAFTVGGFVTGSSGGGGASSGGNIPEPATLALVGLGLLAVAAMGTRRAARAA